MQFFVRITLLTLLFSTFVHAQTTWYVPDDYGTIQGAISDAAVVHGDTVVVRPGTYPETLDFLGKAITVRSASGPDVTVIQGDQTADLVTFQTGESLDSVLDGFTITNGARGVYCADSSPTIQYNVITGNISTSYSGNGAGIYCKSDDAVIRFNRIEENTSAGWGGGVFIYSSSTPVIHGNMICNNTSSFYGGGIECQGTALIVNNIIWGNEAASDGGGLDVYSYCNPHLFNNTIYGNTSSGSGGGINVDSAGIEITNTILWNNTARKGPEIAVVNGPPSSLFIEHSLVQGGESKVYVEPDTHYERGPGMLKDDPEFADPLNGDFHLTINSPCINRGLAVGAPVDDVDGHARPGMGSVDIGADEYTGAHAFTSIKFTLSAAGDTLFLLIKAGAANGGRWCMILGSMSGWTPGTPLPNNGKILPVHWDSFTDFMLPRLNSTVFSNFVLLLHPLGLGTAQIVVSNLNPSYIGKVMTYAYCLEGTPDWDFVSNPLEIEIVP